MASKYVVVRPLRVMVALTLVVACDRAPEAAQSRGGSSAPPPSTAAKTKPQETDPGVNPTAATIAEFEKRVKAYMAVHDKAASGLPSLKHDATPAEVVERQRALEARLVPLRKTARQGDIFQPEMQTFIRRYLGQVFSGPDGAKLKGVVMDENPVDIKYGINSRYPDTVPLSTVPAQVLKALPTLPDGLEYRFIGRDLVLFDVRAHIIIDFVPKVIPA